MPPLVTVLICTNKLSEDLFASIDSACSQDYTNLSLTVFFDGVNPACQDLNKLTHICNNYKRRFDYILEDLNVGLTAGLCALQSSFYSDYYARLDVGDTWNSFKISKQIDFMLSNRCSIVGTRSCYVQNGVQLGLGPVLQNDSNLIIDRIKSFRGVFDHSSILFSGMHKYNAFWYYSQDMMLYVDIANKGGTFGFISEALTNVLYNPEGITICNRPLQLYYEKEARKRLYNDASHSINPIHYAELKKPIPIFAFFYRRYIIYMQGKLLIRAYTCLLFACILDLRLLGYYFDRIKSRLRLPIQ
jgi:hypothetical protein